MTSAVVRRCRRSLPDTLCDHEWRGLDGANYHALEFCGTGVATLDMDDRIVLSNMAVEVGAKAGIFPCDAVLECYMHTIGVTNYTPVTTDEGAQIAREIAIDLTALRPQIALPHRVDNVIDLDDAPFTPVDVVYPGTCTGGRMRDYQEAPAVFGSAGGVKPGVEVVVTPASREIQDAMKRAGMIEAFRGHGARIEMPGCGACCGTCGTIPSDGQRIISSANRDFRGRMGNAAAEIFFASPASCAVAAVRGGFGGDLTPSPTGEAE